MKCPLCQKNIVEPICGFCGCKKCHVDYIVRHTTKGIVLIQDFIKMAFLDDAQELYDYSICFKWDEDKSKSWFRIFQINRGSYEELAQGNPYETSLREIIDLKNKFKQLRAFS